MRILVVLSHTYLESRVVCLEYAIEAASKGNTVFLVDYSEIGSSYQPKTFEQRIISRFKKNALTDVFPDYSTYGVTLIPSSVTSGDANEFHLYENRAFQSLVNSSLSFILGERDASMSEIPRKVYKSMRRIFDGVYGELGGIIHKYRIDHLVTMNGRFLVDGCAILVARRMNLGFSVLERAGDQIGRYEVYPTSPHYIEGRRRLIQKLWNSGLNNKIELANKGLERKLGARLDGGSSWRDDFKLNYDFGKLPRKRTAVFFPSTDLEFVRDRYWQDPETFGGDQKSAFLAFSRIAIEEGYHVVVRVHPPGSRLEIISDAEDLLWSRLCHDVGAEVITSRSGVDSYSLIRDSDLSVTYASSIGIEAMTLGKPTLLLGETDYSHLVPGNCAFDETQIRQMLTEGVPVASLEQLYPWALYYQSGGITYKKFQVDSNQDILLDGVKLEALPRFLKNSRARRVWKSLKRFWKTRL
jgi:hypothetical protein